MAVEVTIAPVNSGYNVSNINDNFEAIEEALQDVVSRSGTTPNNMEATLDMDGHNIINVGTLSATSIVNDLGDLPVITQGLSEWDVGTTYIANDMVAYNNVLYIALRTTVGDTPGASPSDWEVVLEGGEDGTNGTNGADGAFSGVEEIKTGAYTILSSDKGKIIIANSASPFTLAFQAVATIGTAFVVMIKNIGAGTVTLDPNASETIDGATTYSLPQNASVMVNGNGSTFRTYFRENYQLPTASETVVGATEHATVAEIRAGTAGNLVVTAANSLAAAAYASYTYGATITFDHRDGFHRSVTLTGNPTIANPTNVRVGYPLVMWITQDGTGNRVPTWGSNFKLGGATLTLSTTASAQDLVIWHALSATQIIFLGIIKGIQ